VICNVMQTDEQRARSEAVKEKRKALLAARLAKVRQRKNVTQVPDLDIDISATADGILMLFFSLMKLLFQLTHLCPQFRKRNSIRKNRIKKAICQ